MKILFVDDMPECHKYFIRGLPKLDNIGVYWSDNKKEALNEIEEEKYDLVITDYNLGSNDPKGGLEIISSAVDKDIPTILISRENHKDEAISLGAETFIFKKEFFENVERIIFRVLKGYKNGQ